MTETHTIGVTGAAGYIGSRVTRELLARDHDVVPVDDFRNGDVTDIDGCTVRDLDVRDGDALREAFDDVDAVMHLAAVSGVQSCADDEAEAFDVNVGGTETVAWFARERGLPLVFPCSMAIVGEPTEFPITADHPRAPVNHYGLTKKMSEDDVHDLANGEFPAHVFMKSNLYGHHELNGRSIGKNTVINIFVDRAKRGETLEVHAPGTQSRDFVHVKDVARAYPRSLETLLDAEPGATTLPIASGEEHSILEIAELVQEAAADVRGTDVDVEVVENPRGSEAAGEDFTVDTSTARETIGFEAEHTVEDTVRELLAE
ncbi:UDP-glucose 4-epimerase [Halarchaeum rubridurum]|uniref:UDP-glucose 4-epimerase n=1 Tax=Halarchaeum rubridurum TaxID=489911 RepID=A0A830FP63_9EURY|nr:NAD(P)-dependent oxidoreductase [Halarchaeum rubridurum]MBP1953332.1 UDP-glucose 4-epimerase [Halarchaeum rubridurum]GGM66121.1 UDP-glucose 4-epimerase [Halarchaeum rubridurum]